MAQMKNAYNFIGNNLMEGMAWEYQEYQDVRLGWSLKLKCVKCVVRALTIFFSLGTRTSSCKHSAELSISTEDLKNS
jgi:hypothetical protein